MSSKSRRQRVRQTKVCQMCRQFKVERPEDDICRRCTAVLLRQHRRPGKKASDYEGHATPIPKSEVL